MNWKLLVIRTSKITQILNFVKKNRRCYKIEFLAENLVYEYFSVILSESETIFTLFATKNIFLSCY